MDANVYVLIIPQATFRQHIQPCHPSSIRTHQAAAALKIAPEISWEFSTAFSNIGVFPSTSTSHCTRCSKVYQKSAKIAASVVGRCEECLIL
ncbi:uncharacterized protein BO66DRAFT_391429 [Aspergillus aculeatinus CBS 121060]|uniref:Uncharacterized protein n=1 Tax=Aspergillus aculeatinus CBS 121060 TaxID=1448322 RepID=A0ACD1HBG8_9EURO|nr:hypothetical protein BO66DRAFT_391429 [Aspergillus aculeatinus CBS 121060]RAH70981.1 hypothetical protein BO66DRAFT_391429 [Aspergillus aculeatinus CBS 121060]